MAIPALNTWPHRQPDSAIIDACRKPRKDCVTPHVRSCMHFAIRRDSRGGSRVASTRPSRRCDASLPDGETLVRVTHNIGVEAILVQSFNDPDRKLMPALLAADALRRAGASRVTLVAPYLAYMRQDKVFRSGEPISQRVFGQCLGRAFDRVLTVEAHLHRTHRLSDVTGRARSLSAAPAIARWLVRRGGSAIAVRPRRGVRAMDKGGGSRGRRAMGGRVETAPGRSPRARAPSGASPRCTCRGYRRHREQRCDYRGGRARFA